MTPLETNPESLFFATSRARSPLFSMSAFAGNGLSGLVSRVCAAKHELILLPSYLRYAACEIRRNNLVIHEFLCTKPS